MHTFFICKHNRNINLVLKKWAFFAMGHKNLGGGPKNVEGQNLFCLFNSSINIDYFDPPELFFYPTELFLPCIIFP